MKTAAWSPHTLSGTVPTLRLCTRLPVRQTPAHQLALTRAAGKQGARWLARTSLLSVNLLL